MINDREMLQTEHLEDFCLNYFRSCEGGAVDNIIINLPNVDVNVHQSTSSKIEVNLRGKVSVVGGQVRCKARRVNRNIVVALYTYGKVIDTKIGFDIYLPAKDFKLISILSTSNVLIEERIYAKTLKVRTTSGMIKSDVTFEKAILESVSGPIEARFFAESDVETYISSESGDINLGIRNIGRFLIDTHTTLGSVRNYFRQSRSHYTAFGEVSSNSGNIFIN